MRRYNDGNIYCKGGYCQLTWEQMTQSKVGDNMSAVGKYVYLLFCAGDGGTALCHGQGGLVCMVGGFCIVSAKMIFGRNERIILSLARKVCEPCVANGEN